MDKKQKRFSFETKVLDSTNRIIEMIGSTESFDRVQDRMIMSGAKLENYLKNPVILANHSYGYTEKPTVIGRALNVSVQGSKLVFKIQFAETDNAKEWFYLYSEGYMNASSIGFDPLDYEPNGKGGYDFTSWELLELSLVAVPCNPEAVQRAYAAGLISKGLFDQIKTQESGEKMNEEQVKALVAEMLKGLPAQKDYTAEFKTFETSISELTAKLLGLPPVVVPPAVGSIVDHTETIKGLQDQIKELMEKLKEPIGKSGASISAANQAAIIKACDGMSDHIKSLRSMVAKPEPDGDEGKEYTEEQIQKAVEDKITALMKGAK